MNEETKKLTEQELKVLKEVLAGFEVGTYKTTGVKHLSGGFATADMFDYDDDMIDIELKWGVKSDCTDNVNTEQWKLEREHLTSGKTVDEIIDLLQTA